MTGVTFEKVVERQLKFKLGEWYYVLLLKNQHYENKNSKLRKFLFWPLVLRECTRNMVDTIISLTPCTTGLGSSSSTGTSVVSNCHLGLLWPRPVHSCKMQKIAARNYCCRCCLKNIIIYCSFKKHDGKA